MTNSFRPQARPVDTFVQPVSVAPPTDLDVLARALKTVNPGLEAFLDHKMDEAIEEEQLEGIQIAEEEAKEGLKKLTSTIRKKDGDETVRQLVGGSIFAQSAYEKHKAKLVGQHYENELNTFYQNRTFTALNEDGEEVQKPIHHFPLNSPEFQTYSQEINELGSGSLTGISQKNIIKYFNPYKIKAVQDNFSRHRKDHNEFKFARTKKQSVPILWSSFQTYRSGNPQQALNDINEYIEDNVILGLTADKQTKFFKSLIDSGKSVATRAFELTEGSFAAKENAMNDVIDMMGEISHGPGGKDKFRNHLEFETEMSNLRIKLGKESDRLIKRKKERDKALEDKKIEEAVRDSVENIDALEQLVKDLPHRKEYILDRIELEETDRTDRFIDLLFDVGSGEINREDALKELAQLRTDIGSTITEEDETNFTKVYKAISTYKSIDNQFNTRLTKTIQDGHRRMGSIDPLIGAYENVDVGKDISELNVQLRRDMIDTIALPEIDPTTGKPKKLSSREKEKAYRDLEDQYYKDIDALKKKYDLDTFDFDNKKDKKNEGNEAKDKEKDDKEGGFSTFMELLKKGLSTTTPGGGSPATAGDLQDKLTSYTVKAGDTLSELAGQFKTTINEIKEANNIADEDFINIGQSLLMPINTIGDALVPESDLQNPSVLEEIDVTKPFTFNSLERLSQEVGFPPKDAKIAAAIALAESDGNAQIDTVKSGLDPNKEKEFSLGLWQINVMKEYQKERFPLFNIKQESELYNPLTNAKAAKILYDRAGGSFEDWSTYTSGKYKDYLPKTN